METKDPSSVYFPPDMEVLENSFGEGELGRAIFSTLESSVFFCLGCQYLILLSLGFVVFFGEKTFFSPGVIYLFFLLLGDGGGSVMQLQPSIFTKDFSAF